MIFRLEQSITVDLRLEDPCGPWVYEANRQPRVELVYFLVTASSCYFAACPYLSQLLCLMETEYEQVECPVRSLPARSEFAILALVAYLFSVSQQLVAHFALDLSRLLQPTVE